MALGELCPTADPLPYASVVEILTTKEGEEVPASGAAFSSRRWGPRILRIRDHLPGRPTRAPETTPSPQATDSKRTTHMNSTYGKKELAGKGPQRTFKGDDLQQIAFPLGGDRSGVFAHRRRG